MDMNRAAPRKKIKHCLQQMVNKMETSKEYYLLLWRGV